jgi:hypothetical protein
MSLQEAWTKFKVESEVSSYGASRLAKVHNSIVTQSRLDLAVVKSRYAEIREENRVLSEHLKAVTAELNLYKNLYGRPKW